MFWYSEEFTSQLLKKNELSFAKFYQDTVDMFYRYVKSNYNLPEHAVQDILSEMYIKFRNSLDRLSPLQNIQSYCWTILKNTTLDSIKKNKEISFSELSSDEEGTSFEEGLEDSSSLHTLFNTSFESERIQEAIYSLDEKYKDVLFLKYIQGLENNEIAEHLWIQEDNVRQRIARWLQKLRSLLC